MSRTPIDQQPSTHVWIEVTGPIRETDKAYLYETAAGEIWVPKSQLGARKKGLNGKHVKIELPRWIAKEKGLLDEKDER
jgi:hypothetical protein